MKRPSNRAIGLYLIWVLVHFTVLFTTNQCNNASEIFYPFTKGRYGNYGWYRNNFVIDAYDISEFVFYTISLVLIYFILKLLGFKNLIMVDNNSIKSIESNSKFKNWIISHVEKSNGSEWSTQITFIRYLIFIIIFSFLVEIYDIVGSQSINLDRFDIVSVGVHALVFFVFSHVIFFIYLILRFVLLRLMLSKVDLKFSFWTPIPYVNLFFITLIVSIIFTFVNLE